MEREYDAVQLVLFTNVPCTNDANKVWVKSDIAFDLTRFEIVGPGHSQAQGLAGDQLVTLSVQPSRVDVVVQGVPDEAPMKPPALHDLKSACDLALSVAEKISPQVPTGRTAVVMQGRTIVDDASAAVADVRNQLPGLPVPDGTDDVTFQIVSSKTSSIKPERTMRRIVKWQTIAMQMVDMTPLNVQGLPNIRQLQASHLYVDIYHDGLEQLSPEEAIASLREYVAEATSIVQGGIESVR